MSIKRLQVESHPSSVDKFLVDYAEKMYKPDTVKAHLLSLRNFCSFVKTEEPSSVTVDVATIEKN